MMQRCPRRRRFLWIPIDPHEERITNAARCPVTGEIDLIRTCDHCKRKSILTVDLATLNEILTLFPHVFTKVVEQRVEDILRESNL